MITNFQFPGFARASHEGGSQQLQTCVDQKRLNSRTYYWAHFEVFQKTKGYCHRVPDTGPVIIVLGLKHELRDVPVKIIVKYTEESDDEKKSEVILSKPATVYSNGIARIETSLSLEGRYLVILNPKKPNTSLRFPFRVGSTLSIAKQLEIWSLQLMTKPNILLLLFLGAVGIYGLIRFSTSKSGT